MKKVQKFLLGVVIGLTAVLIALSIGGIYYFGSFVIIDDVKVKAAEVGDYEVYLKDTKPIFDIESIDKNITYEVDVVDNGLFEYSDIRYTRKVDYANLTNSLNQYNEEKCVKYTDAYLSNDGSHYVIIPESYGTTVDVAKVVEYVRENEQKVDLKVNLVDYFEKPQVVTDDIQYLADNLNKYVDWHVTYGNGLSIASSFDKVTYIEGSFTPQLNKDFIKEQLKEVSKTYNTVGDTRLFVTNQGQQIEVSGGTWGSYIDDDAEYDYIVELFEKGESEENRNPILESDRDEIGNTYIEISIEEQHMWYYNNGICLLDTDVVTGDLSRNRGTPRGVYYVIEHLKEKWMTGGDYRTLAHRWMRLTWSGVGIHDAYWRYSFGGNIYKYDGSHGCINTPSKAMYDLYDMTKNLIPVVIY